LNESLRLDESLRDHFKPKSKEDIKREILNLNQDQKDKMLIYTSENGMTNEVKFLLNHGANVHVNNEQPLRWTSTGGYTEIVKLLLDHGADVHANNDYSLRWASIHGHTDVVKLLIDAGANESVLKK